MNLKELDSFKISDAVSFHDELNPVLWDNQRLRPEVKDQLLVIAKDFLEELGVNDLDVVDVTVSGSNAAYSYTPHSDLDLHILVDLSKLDNNEIYKELFHAKKTIYNDTHNITIHGVPVELYVQDAREPVVSLGEYSILHDKWLRIPTKRRANLDQTATKQKYEKLLAVVRKTLQSKNVLQVEKVISKIRQYRKAGLDKGGEFGPENLAYKILRKQGLIDKLYNLKDKLHSEKLTIEEENPLLNKPTLTIRQVAEKHGVSFTDIMDQLVKGVNVELEHTNDEKVAREIALDHLSEDPEYYTKLASLNLEEDSWAMSPNLYAAEKTLPVTPYGNKEREFRGSIAETIVDVWGPSVEPNKAIHSAVIGDYEFRAVPRYKPANDTIDQEEEKSLEIIARDASTGKMVGAARFDIHGNKKDQWLESDSTFVGKQYQGKGIAYMMYAYAKSLGFDIKRSPTQTQAGKEMWDKWGSDAKNLMKEASGYIPSEKERNDPRFKTALTVDVHPDTMKKDAKKYGNKINRAGIPPTARPDGKF